MDDIYNIAAAQYQMNIYNNSGCVGQGCNINGCIGLNEDECDNFYKTCNWTHQRCYPKDQFQNTTIDEINELHRENKFVKLGETIEKGTRDQTIAKQYLSCETNDPKCKVITWNINRNIQQFPKQNKIPKQITKDRSKNLYFNDFSLEAKWKNDKSNKKLKSKLLQPKPNKLVTNILNHCDNSNSISYLKSNQSPSQICVKKEPIPKPILCNKGDKCVGQSRLILNKGKYVWEHHGIPLKTDLEKNGWDKPFFNEFDKIMTTEEQLMNKNVENANTDKEIFTTKCWGLSKKQCVQNYPLTCNWKSNKCQNKQGYKPYDREQMKKGHTQIWNAAICINPDNNGRAYLAESIDGLEKGTRVCGDTRHEYPRRHIPMLRRIKHWIVDDTYQLKKIVKKMEIY
jgi:hypothetical protein